MEIFLKITACVLITTIMTLVITKHNSSISLLLTIFVCCISITAAISYLKPVIAFLEKLVRVGQIDDAVYGILLKSTGIALITQIASSVCADGGNQSMGKVLQFIGTTTVLCLCIPLLDRVLVLIESVLGSA